MSNVKKARELYAQGATHQEISKLLNESPFLVAQWTRKKKNKKA